MFLVSIGLFVCPSMHPFVKLKDNVTLYYCIIAIIKKVNKKENNCEFTGICGANRFDITITSLLVYYECKL